MEQRDAAIIDMLLPRGMNERPAGKSARAWEAAEMVQAQRAPQVAMKGGNIPTLDVLLESEVAPMSAKGSKALALVRASVASPVVLRALRLVELKRLLSSRAEP